MKFYQFFFKETEYCNSQDCDDMKCEDSYFNLGIAFHLDKQTPNGALQKMKLFMKTMTKRWTNENGQNVFGGDNAQLSVFRNVFTNRY